MNISNTINAITSCFCGPTTTDNDASSASILSASNSAPSHYGAASSRALTNPRGTVHPGIRQYMNDAGNQNAALHLPQELKTKITKFANPASLKAIRLIDKGFNAAATEEIKELVVTRSSDLQKALRAYSPGGIDSVTLKGDNFTISDLTRLPRDLKQLTLSDCRSFRDGGLAYLPKSLQKLDLSGCTRLTDEALPHLFGMPLKELKLNECYRITTSALDNFKKKFDSLKIEHRRRVEPPEHHFQHGLFGTYIVGPM